MYASLWNLPIAALLVLSGHHVMGQAPGAGDPAVRKQVAELIKQADRSAQAGAVQFVHAETLYEEALKLDPGNAELQMKMGLCQLNGPYRHKALAFFQQAQELAPDMPRIHFLTGYAHQLNAQWDEAIACYERHKRTVVNGMPDPDPRYNMADKHLAECRNGRTLMAAPVGAELKNLGPQINSDASDYGALVTADGGTLIFTTRRKPAADAKVNKATGEYYEEVYISRSGDGGWSEAAPAPAPINTPGNDASVGLHTSDGTLILYRDLKGTGDLYECSQQGGQWSEPKAFGPVVNSPAHETSAWISADRQWLYFVSDRPDDSVGGQDIYRSPWDATASTWGPAENLGPDVNSIHDEEGVFLHPDGQTLYFSSRGHTSMGGFDIFRTRFVDGRWTKPENLGWPINSPDDDLYFVLAPDGRTGYFSSIRPGGAGDDDIYQVSLEEVAGMTPAGAR